MNGTGTRKNSFPSDHEHRYDSGLHVRPPFNVLLDGYNGVLGDFSARLPRFNHIKGPHIRNSQLLDPNDPVSMHLLMETAIGDSQKYEVLSFEEVDELKKELAVLASRIDPVKRKLALESKLRDAATSINRLDSQTSHEGVNDRLVTSPQKHRRSIGSIASGSDVLNKRDDELTASTKKCEDLAQELWRLERRSQELQTRLLEHTAGVLQMTHKGFLDKDIPNQNEGMNGSVGGSHNAGFLYAEHDFDDQSFYSSLDEFLKPNNGHEGDATAFAQHNESIVETERRLWDLNNRLRDAISQVCAGRSIIPAPPDPGSSNMQEPDIAVQEQILYLENGFGKMQDAQVEISKESRQTAHATEQRLENLNTQLRGVIIRSSQDQTPQFPPPPDVLGQSSEGQFTFLEDGLYALERSVQLLKEEGQTSSSRSIVHEEKAGQSEGVIRGLWEILLAGEEESRKWNKIPGDSSPVVSKEIFSLESLSSKVRSVHTRASDLQLQKETLVRQVQQQRELNSKSDVEKDAHVADLTAELEQTKKTLDATNAESTDLSAALNAQLSASNQAQDKLSSELHENLDVVLKLESQLQTVQGDHEQYLNTARSLEQQLVVKSAETEKARTEMQNFEGEVVRLQTELTVVRAELDGAYGTRAQRAAEVASHPALQKEISELSERNTALQEEIAGTKATHEAVGDNATELNQRVQLLQKELSEMISEYEVMTKSSIEYEKERENLEYTIDGLRDRCESLETQINDEKVRWLGVKSPGESRPLGSRESMEKGATSTAVLKNEFKKMMRETRAENMRALRFEQDERRKLEAQIRALKRDQAPGKSSLSQSMTAI